MSDFIEAKILLAALDHDDEKVRSYISTMTKREREKLSNALLLANYLVWEDIYAD